jgi:calcineurin-like phosphoesterase
MPSDVLTVVFIGDVIGKPGREGAARYLKGINADFKIINGESIIWHSLRLSFPG